MSSSSSIEQAQSHGDWRSVAVIDIGATSIRMAIAQIDLQNNIRILDRLQQAVNLGKDSFTQGTIRRSTIEQCVAVLNDYVRILDEYGVNYPDQVRVVATSAVREADNRMAFLDRVYIATGLDVEAIEEAEVSRVTYLGIRARLEEASQVAPDRIVCEVGGGSTAVLLLKSNTVAHSQSYRLGSLRLRKGLEEAGAPSDKLRRIMETQIGRIVDQVREHVPEDVPLDLVALGADVRFAASQLIKDWQPTQLSILPLDALVELTEKIMETPATELVQQYQLSQPDAETLGPALLTYSRLASALNVDHLLVTNINLRDGLLQEMASGEVWLREFQHQVIGPLLERGRQFDFDEPHALHVGMLARSLFHQMADQHGLDMRYETILYIAAVLHEIGVFISSTSYHKHSLYLIRNSELFGIGPTNLELIAQVARYHRRASPKQSHKRYMALDRDQRVVVSKLASILRIAVALDASRSQNIHSIQVARSNGKLVVSTDDVNDLTLEQLALQQSGTLFEETYGVPVILSVSMETG
jgi:exopolyphosphatase/guanosine-5'-triphosphate,3'-diphosphate pyrophosphatase